jgi:hypothetical protein
MVPNWLMLTTPHFPIRESRFGRCVVTPALLGAAQADQGSHEAPGARGSPDVCGRRGLVCCDSDVPLAEGHVGHDSRIVAPSGRSEPAGETLLARSPVVGQSMPLW